MDGLRHMTVEPCILGPQDVLISGPTRVSDHQHLLAPCMPANGSAHHEPVEPRHLQVEDYDVGLPFSGRRESLHSIMDDMHLMAMRAKQGLQGVALSWTSSAIRIRRGTTWHTLLTEPASCTGASIQRFGCSANYDSGVLLPFCEQAERRCVRSTTPSGSA